MRLLPENCSHYKYEGLESWLSHFKHIHTLTETSEGPMISLSANFLNYNL